jgi:hypothetical protein
MATLQEFYFRKALEEINGIFIGINHRDGTCKYMDVHHKEITTANIIYPSSLVSAIDTIKVDKDISVFFQGSISSNRQWLKNYEIQHPETIIVHSGYGRDHRFKYEFHTAYFTNMKRAQFVLCPVGDCRWSYRFFEAMLCGAIPVMELNSDDKFYKDYYTVKIGDEPFIYDEEKALENYKKVLTAVTLQK